jgi:hypothetical protein
MVAVADPERKRCPVSEPVQGPVPRPEGGRSAQEDLQAESRKLGRDPSSGRPGLHFRICLKGVKPEVLAQEIADASKEAKTTAEMDFATLVKTGGQPAPDR